MTYVNILSIVLACLAVFCDVLGTEPTSNDPDLCDGQGFEDRKCQPCHNKHFSNKTNEMCQPCVIFDCPEGESHFIQNKSFYCVYFFRKV